MKSVKIIFLFSILLIFVAEFSANAQVFIGARFGRPYYARRYYYAPPPPVYYRPLPPPVIVSTPPPQQIWVGPHWKIDRWGNRRWVNGHYRRW